jgi:hypothetical protein
VEVVADVAGKGSYLAIFIERLETDRTFSLRFKLFRIEGLTSQSVYYHLSHASSFSLVSAAFDQHVDYARRAHKHNY